MSKLYRSLLWSGLVAAGVAACGDDVTVTPPAPVSQVHSVSVGPSATINIGQTLQMAAAVNAEPNVATTVTWVSSNPSIASVNATSGLVTGNLAGSVAITACSTVVTSVCGQATVIVSSAPVPTVTSVILTPPAPFLPRTTPATTLQLFAAVVGTNNPPQTVTWQASPNPAIATISATGLITVPTNSTGGTVVFTACSTLAGFTNVCGSSALVVTIPSPATVSYQAATWVPPAALPSCVPGPGPEVSINVLAVSCQIQVTANVNAGDQVLNRLDVLIGGQVVASQTFPGTVASDGTPQGVTGPIQVTLPVNTQQLRRPGATLFTPAILNGNQPLSLNLFVVGAAVPFASVATPIVMNNPDAALKIGAALTLVNNSSSPSFVDGGGFTWFTGTQTAGAVNYISFSATAPTALPFGSTVCGASSSSAVTGTPTTGLSISSTFTCAGVEGPNTLTGVAFPATYAVATGPDGTLIIPAGAFSNIGTAFCVPVAGNPIFVNPAAPACDANSSQRWNMFAPGTLPTIPAAVRVDNKAPVVTLAAPVAFNSSFDQFWVNAAYNFLASAVFSVDGGTGVASENAYAHVPGIVTCSTATPVTTGADLAETVVSDGTPDGYRLCGRATDNIGNVSGLVGFSNFFGVDKVAPLTRIAGTTGALPLIGPSTVPAVSATPNTTIYSIAAPFLVTDSWAIEAQDTRSGFHTLLGEVSPFPITRSETRLGATGTSGCTVGPSFKFVTVLSDTWVRSSIGGTFLMDCGTGLAGYETLTMTVTDRAGNATPLVRNWAIDQYAAPVLSSIGPAAVFYTPGAAANFFLFGSDDLEIITADLGELLGGIATATDPLLTGITKPNSLITGCARFDAVLCNILAGATVVDPFWLSRIDRTCSGAGAPYASCAAIHALPPTTSQFNNVAPGTDDDKNATGVSAVAFDVASQASGTVAAGLLTAQTTPDVAMQWGAAADILTWKVNSIAGTTVIAEHKASTSITAPYFDSVVLGRANAGGTAIVFCGNFPAPVLTDNGFNRFWTYTVSKPVAPAACSAGGLWYAIGLKSGAALITQGL